MTVNQEGESPELVRFHQPAEEIMDRTDISKWVPEPLLDEWMVRFMNRVRADMTIKAWLAERETNSEMAKLIVRGET